MVTLATVQSLFSRVECDLVEPGILNIPVSDLVSKLMESAPDMPNEKVHEYIYYRLMFYLFNRADVMTMVGDQREADSIYSLLTTMDWSKDMKHSMLRIRSKLLLLH